MSSLLERIEEIHINVHGQVVVRYTGGRCEDVTDKRGTVIYRPEPKAALSQQDAVATVIVKETETTAEYNYLTHLDAASTLPVGETKLYPQPQKVESNHDWQQRDEKEYECKTCGADSDGLPSECIKVPQSVEEFTWANFVSYLIDNCEGEAITEERLQHALSDMMTGVRYCPSMPATYREAELKGVVVNNNLAGDQILLAHPPHTTIPMGTVMISCAHPDISHDCCVVCGKSMMPNKPDFEWLAAKGE